MMRAFTALVVVMLALSCATGSFAQNLGATITFDVDGMTIYEGSGSTMTPREMGMPITVGNFRITGVALPGDAWFEYAGLVLPQGGAIDERLVVIDNSSDSPQSLALLCEVIDSSAPLGFRLRTNSYRRGDTSTWIGLMLAPGHTRAGKMRPLEQGRRFSSDPVWYAQVDPMVLGGSREFSIVLDVGGHGTFSLRQIEIKSWPTRPMMMTQ